MKRIKKINLPKNKAVYTTFQYSEIMKSTFPGVRGFTRQNINLSIRNKSLIATRDENSRIHLITAEEVKRQMELVIAKRKN